MPTGPLLPAEIRESFGEIAVPPSTPQWIISRVPLCRFIFHNSFGVGSQPCLLLLLWHGVCSCENQCHMCPSMQKWEGGVGHEEELRPLTHWRTPGETSSNIFPCCKWPIFPPLSIISIEKERCSNIWWNAFFVKSAPESFELRSLIMEHNINLYIFGCCKYLYGNPCISNPGVRYLKGKKINTFFLYPNLESYFSYHYKICFFILIMPFLSLSLNPQNSV